MNYAQLFRFYEQKLQAVGEESDSLTFTYRSLKNLSTTDFYLSLREEVSDKDTQFIDQIFQKLAKHIPAQYIIGHSEFFGLQLKVTPSVLIPRPETEELVALLLSENSQETASALDIGTGSGAIAIAMKKHRPDWQVTASDISTEALMIAQENAVINQTTLTFAVSDVCDSLTGRYDIIVSNPPYISRADLAEVGLNVLHAEPHLALFAEEDGLAIYRKIAEQAGKYLTEKGKLYLEIGYKQASAVQELLATHFPDKRVRVITDSFQKERMVVMDDNA